MTSFAHQSSDDRPAPGPGDIAQNTIQDAQSPLSEVTVFSAEHSTGIDPRLLIPRSLYFKHPEQVCVARGDVRLVIFDLDETLISNTGEIVHDGVYGRFSYAARHVIRTSTGVMIPIEEWQSIWEEGVPSEGIPPLGSFKGQAEQSVYSDLATTLIKHSRFGLSALSDNGSMSVDQLVTALATASDNFFSVELKKHANRLKIVEGVADLVRSCNDQGIMVALCTASGPRFISALREIPEFAALLQEFDDMRTVKPGAKKKVSYGKYCGEDVERLCNELGVDPAYSIMVGDQLSDAGAHSLAGGKVAFLCLGGSVQERAPRSRKLLEEYCVARENHDNLVASYQIIVGDTFLRFRIQRDADSNRPIYVEVGKPDELGLPPE